MFELDIRLPVEWKKCSIERLVWSWTILLFAKERIDDALQEMAAEFKARGLNVPPTDAKTAKMRSEILQRANECSKQKEKPSDEPPHYYYR